MLFRAWRRPLFERPRDFIPRLALDVRSSPSLLLGELLQRSQMPAMLDGGAPIGTIFACRYSRLQIAQMTAT
ncbi:MAG: hypothetical protein ACJ8LI_04020 [Chthoniobacterales bacterium]